MHWRKIWFEEKTGRLRCWWRVLLYLGMAMVTTITIMLFLATLFLPTTTKDLTHIPLITQALLLFIAMVSTITGFTLSGVWASRTLENLPPYTIGISLRNQWLRSLLVAFTVGLGMAVVLLCAMTMCHLGHMHRHTLLQHNWQMLAFAGCFCLLISISLEVVFHGYLFQTLMRGIGPLPSLLIIAAFGAGIECLNVKTISPIALANAFILFILLGMAYLRSGSLWASIGLCAGWNMSSLLLHHSATDWPFGIVSPMTFTLHGPLWLTGGPLGLDGGAIGAVGLLILLALVTYLRGGLTIESRWWEWQNLRQLHRQPPAWDFRIGSRTYQWKLLVRDQAE